MGNIYARETRDIEEVRELVKKHQCLGRYLSHHIRNSLMRMDLGIMRKDWKVIEAESNHIIQDLEEVGL